MKTLLMAVIVVMALTVSMLGAPPAWAHSSNQPPEDLGCPPPFALHHAHDHSHDGTHNHIGNDADQNKDDWICVKHVGKGGKNHVHIDNSVPQ